MKLRTDDELRAMLIDEYDELLKVTDGIDGDDAPNSHIAPTKAVH